MTPTLARDRARHSKAQISPDLPRTSAEVDRREFEIQASTPDLQNTNLYLDSAPQPHPFSQGMDVLSWTSSNLPYLQYDQPLPSELSHSMTLDFNPHAVSAPLDILNAERYDFGSQYVPNPRGKGKRSPAVEGEDHQLPFGMTRSSQLHSANSKASSEEHEGPQKKRARVEILSDEDDVSKKSRGRPRLDTNDKTAQDVRSSLQNLGHFWVFMIVRC